MQWLNGVRQQDHIGQWKQRNGLAEVDTHNLGHRRMIGRLFPVKASAPPSLDSRPDHALKASTKCGLHFSEYLRKALRDGLKAGGVHADFFANLSADIGGHQVA